jgi:hypothetical protein
MSAVVFIPASLVHHMEQSRRVSVTGETLGAVIEQLEPDFPGIRKALCDDAGRLHRFLRACTIRRDRKRHSMTLGRP